MPYKFTLITLLFSQLLFSQTSEISGIITLDHKPILGATILLMDLQRGTTSDENGLFTISNVPYGNQLFHFSYVGAKDIKQRIMVTKSNHTLRINLFSDDVLDEVIISVPGSQLQKDLVVNVEKVKISEIYQSSSNSLAESISNINGVSQNSTGNSIGKPVIRGLTSNRVVTYAQGTRIENQQWGAEHGLGISSNGIKSVEVIKGPASLLYGSDAIGGVLYFVDEDFTNKKTEGVVETSYFTNTQTTQNRLGVKLGFGDFKVDAYAGYILAGDYKLSNEANFSADRVFNTRFSERSGKISLGLVREAYKSKLTYSYLNNFFGIPVPIDENPVFGNSTGIDLIFPFKDQSSNFVLPFQDVSQHNLALENNFKIYEASTTLTLGYAVNDRQEFNEELDNPDLHLYLQVLSYNVKISNVIKNSKIDVTLGAQGLYQDSENRGTVFLIPDGTSLENGVFGLFNYKINNNLRFQSGLRYDSKQIKAESVVVDGITNFADFNETYNTLNYSVGTKYDVADFSFRFNIASGYRAPNTSELLSNGEHGGVGRIEVGDQNLESESATQFDFSINYKNRDLDITFNPFFNTIKDYIFISPTGERGDGDLPIFAYLQEDANLFGAEFALNYVPFLLPKLNMQIGAAITYGNNNTNDPLPFIPPANFNTKFSYHLDIGKQLRLNSVYLQQQNFLEQNRVTLEELSNSDYHLINLGLDASFGKFNFNFAIKNLFDRNYTNHLSRLKTSFENFVVPNPGRDIVFNLKYHF